MTATMTKRDEIMGTLIVAMRNQKSGVMDQATFDIIDNAVMKACEVEGINYSWLFAEAAEKEALEELSALEAKDAPSRNHSEVSRPVDMAAFEAWARKRGLDQKFDVADVQRTPRLRLVANEYARNYNGDFEFMLDMKKTWELAGHFTLGQAKGVLNCYLAELRRSGRKTAPAAASFAGRALEGTIENATYTVVDANGEHFTVKLSAPTFGEFPVGTQMVSYLSGPDNEADFTGCAFLSDGRVKFWNRYKGQPISEKINAALSVIAGAEDRSAFRMAYALKSGRCARCNRKLTVPASIHRGLGPTCAAEMNQ